MKLHESAFYFIFFFLLGVLLASLNLKFLAIAFITALTAVLFLFLNYFFKKPRVNFKWLSIFSLLMIVGSIYYFWNDFQLRKNFSVVFDKKINFTGVVLDYPQKGASQKITVNLQRPFSGKILITLRPYPQFNYGDKINFEGVVKKPEGSYANYLAKEEILGISSFPKTKLIATKQGSKIKSALFFIKEKFVLVFQKTLPSEEAAFASGLTIGEKSDFSKDLKDAMAKSGTTHIVALSGYNISVIVWAVALALGLLFKRNTTFIITLLILVGFVLMAGAQASVVRAALIGAVVLMAKQIGRVYSFRNAISVSAFLMVLQNPKILVFDVGFQLSFLAFLGIVYLPPAFIKIFKLGDETAGKKISEWKDILLTTISAQLAVLPVLISAFGRFSPLSILANILILWLIPFTMGVAFLAGFLGFFSYYLALFSGWFLHLFLYYELSVIKFFGKFSPPVNLSFGFFTIALYYAALIIFIVMANKRSPRATINSSNNIFRR